MERPAIDQAIELLTRAARPLLLVPAEPSTDAFCSMVALSLTLEKMGKEPEMVTAGHVPQSLQFLPGTSQVHEMIERTRDLVLELSTDTVRVAGLDWKQENGKVRIVLTPEKGKRFPVNTPSMTAGTYPWDCIVTIGSTDLNRLGAPFTEHAPFFYETPILNIDRGTANEFFGAVNLVVATSGTVAEVVYELLDTLGGVNLLTPEIATCLYAGLLSGTHSFQSPQTSPRTLLVASTLLEQQADRETVTRNLFASHTLPELRLLGRTLARLRELPEGVLWSVIATHDFSDSSATPDLLPRVLQEIVERAGDALPIVLVFERTPQMLEALVSPGRVSPEDRLALRDRTRGSLTGTFILVNLGQHAPGDAERLVREMILPALPKRSA